MTKDRNLVHVVKCINSKHCEMVMLEYDEKHDNQWYTYACNLFAKFHNDGLRHEVEPGDYCAWAERKEE